MALADFDQVISLSQTIDAIFESGKSLPQALRFSYGRLVLTSALADIPKRLDARYPSDAQNSSELH